MSEESKFQRRLRAATVFKPSSPIDSVSLFAGRKKEVQTISNAVVQTGQHALIYGERGVGKTSLVGLLSQFLENLTKHGWLFVRMNCNSDETFSALWRRILREIQVTQIQDFKTAGFEKNTAQTQQGLTLDKMLPEFEFSPDDLRILFNRIGTRNIVILDEVDRIENRQVRRLLADTIKALSDHSSPTTLILVGVADSVDGLIDDHLSIERALVQMHLPRMSLSELNEALSKCLAELEMSITDEAAESIVSLSRGLPHFTHALGLYAAQTAIDFDRTLIAMNDIETAIHEAISKTSQSIRSKYYNATHSGRKTLYADVLLACALCETDELGFFIASDVKLHMAELTGRNYEVSAFASHLREFAGAKRYKILERVGEERNFRYRFVNPMMQPFVIMKGIATEKLSHDALRNLMDYGH